MDRLNPMSTQTMKRYWSLPFLALCLASSASSLAQSEDSNPDALMQRELIRRDELLLSSTRKLEEAEILLNAGKKAEARAIVDEVLSEIPNAGRGQEVYQKAAALLADMNLRDAEAYIKEKKWYEARDLADQVLVVDPGNVRARIIIAKTDAALGIPRGEDEPESPAVDRKFVQRLNAVDDHLQAAKDFIGTGQLDQAESELLLVLKVDPYHKAASNLLKKVYSQKYRAAEIAHESDRESKLTKVREGWSFNVEADIKQDASPQATQPLLRSNQFEINQKLKTLIIPEVNFDNATVQDAALFLTAETRKIDSTGVNFLIGNAQVMEQAKPFSLKLRNVPVGEVLRYIASLAGVKYKIEEFAVFIVPLTDRTEVLVTREFPVQMDFWDVKIEAQAPASPTNRRRPRSGVTSVQPTSTDRHRAVLESRGVVFPQGSSAIYNPSTGILRVTNTQDNIDLIEELVTVGTGEQLIVKIETRLVEINQSDLESLAFNYRLAGNPDFVSALGYGTGLGGTSQIAFGAASGGTNLQGANAVREVDGINTFINDPNPVFPSAFNNSTFVRNNNVTTNSIGVNTVLAENAFSALIQGVSQADSADIMTAPSVVVLDGETGKITVAREFQYPIEFDQPQVQTRRIVISEDLQFDIAPIVIPAWPTDFEQRKVGVSMTVVPKVTVDRQRVFLTINPVVTEFDGFINYGAALFTTVDDFGNSIPSTRLVDNQILQPVFSTREVQNAKVEIRDGYTLVLGGLLREDVATVEDKVPFLGDLPGVGRLFRSKSEQAIKKNLLIFVTVRILRPNGQPFNIATGPQEVAAVPAPAPGS